MNIAITCYFQHKNLPYYYRFLKSVDTTHLLGIHDYENGLQYVNDWKGKLRFNLASCTVVVSDNNKVEAAAF